MGTRYQHPEIILGVRFRETRLTPVGKYKKGKFYYFICRCDCERIAHIRKDSLNKNTTTSCGCFKKEKAEKVGTSLIGKKNNFLTVLEYTPQVRKNNGKNNSTTLATVRCLCDCGNDQVFVTPRDFRKGHVKSCCLMSLSGEKHPNHSHGLTSHPIFSRWCSIRSRCKNKKSKKNKNYIKKKIKVCDLWDSEESGLVSFYAWTQEWCFNNDYKDVKTMLKSGLSIERVNNSEGYSPQNCTWISPLQQAQNRDSTHWVLFNGSLYSLSEAHRRFSPPGLSVSLVRSRIADMLWDPQVAILTPPKKICKIGENIDEKSSC